MKKVAIGVGGRFHSDFMYQSLNRLGFSTQVFTSLPKSKFPIPETSILNCIWPEMVFRVTRNLGLESSGDAFKMKAFGKFLSQRMTEYQPNFFVGWSSFSLETLRKRPAETHFLMRDSAHIKFQYDLLAEEYDKFGHVFPMRDFCLQRELEEYQLTDRIWVLSEFAKKTFVQAGTKPEKLDVLPLGVDLERFRPLEHVPKPSPLRVLYFGSLNFRKGVQYLLEATKDFSPKQIELNLIGSIAPEFKKILASYSHFNHQNALTQKELAKEIRKHHVFVFPTLEDGFGQTLIQAMASGLIPITTKNCGAADFTSLDEQELRIDPRAPEQIKAKLEHFLRFPDLLEPLRQKFILDAQKMTWERYENHLSRLLSLNN